MNAWVVIPVILLLAIVYVMLPVGLAVRTWYRHVRTVRCPEAGLDAAVAVDASQAGLAAAVGRRARRVTGCALWPERQACGRQCVARSAMA